MQEVFCGTSSTSEGEPRKEKLGGTKGYRFSIVVVTATSPLYLKYFPSFFSFFGKEKITHIHNRSRITSRLHNEHFGLNPRAFLLNIFVFCVLFDYSFSSYIGNLILHHCSKILVQYCSRL